MVKSPCNRECGLGSEGFCVSCGRTVREIRIWSKCDDKEKQKIIEQSRLRIGLPPVRDKGVSD